MRKQYRWIAVLSAALLMAAGAFTTALAAEGWKEDNGQWVYETEDGDLLTNAWKKSGSNYYYLDADGRMVTSQFIEINDDLYYVDANGVRAANQWITIPNDGLWDAEVKTIRYFFDTSGKAYKNIKKTIASKIHIFDEEGRALSGWQYFVNDLSGEEELYYLGGEAECYAYVGWQLLEPMREVFPEDGGNYDAKEWFYFNETRGNAYVGRVKYLNQYERYYNFDINGVMQTGWVINTKGLPAFYARKDTPDTGARQQGWYYTYSWDDPDCSGEQYWFYLDMQGVPFNIAGKDAQSGSSAEKMKLSHESWESAETNYAAKVIKSKTYLFDESGKMQTGVFRLGNVNRAGSSTRLGHYESCDEETDEGKIYYFNMNEKDSENKPYGSMLTGKITVNDDGDNVYFYFDKKGQAYQNTIADGSLYGPNGVRVNATDGNTYQLFEIKEDTDLPIIYLKDQTAPLKDPKDGPYQVIVNNSGKVVENRTVNIDGYRYTTKDYIVIKREAID